MPIFSADFEETSGYTIGDAVSDVAGWTVDQGSAIIVGNEAAGGDQSLKIAATGAFGQARLTLDTSNAGQPFLFLDMKVKAKATDLSEKEEMIDINGARIGFFRVAGTNLGEFYIFDGDGQGGGVWRRTWVTKPVGAASGVSDDWIRLSVREDNIRQGWDLSISGSLTIANAGFQEFIDPTSDEKYIFMSATAEPLYLDNLYVQTENPTVADSDGDGMADAMDPDDDADDRDADEDWDGISNIQEAVRGTLEESFADSDNDGISDINEERFGTAASDGDMDDDGKSDRQEIAQGTDPDDNTDSVVTSVDKMQLLELSVGDASGDTGAVYVATVYEKRKNGTEWKLRYTLTRSGADQAVVSSSLKCRAAADYVVTVNKTGGIGNAKYLLDVNPRKTNGTPYSGVRLMDQFSLLSKGPSNTDVNAITGVRQHLTVLGLPPVVYWSSPPAPSAAQGFQWVAVDEGRSLQLAQRQSREIPFRFTLNRSDYSVTTLGKKTLYAGTDPIAQGSQLPPSTVITMPARREASQGADSQDSVALETRDAQGNPVERTVPSSPVTVETNGSPDTVSSGCGCGAKQTKDKAGEEAKGTPAQAVSGVGSVGSAPQDAAKVNLGYAVDTKDPSSMLAVLSNFRETVSGSEIAYPANGVALTQGEEGGQKFMNVEFGAGRRNRFENFTPGANFGTAVGLRLLNQSLGISGNSFQTNFHYTYVTGFPTTAIDGGVWKHNQTRWFWSSSENGSYAQRTTEVWPVGSATTREVTTERYEYAAYPNLGAMISSSTTVFKMFPWGESIVSQTLNPIPSDPANTLARTTVYDYWLSGDAGNSGPASTGKLRSVRDLYSGSWSYFKYDALGRLIKSVRQFLGAPCPLVSGRVNPTLAEENANVTLTITRYADDPEKRVENVTTLGVTTSRTLYSSITDNDQSGIREEQCQSASATFGSPGNITSDTYFHSDNQASVDGRLARVVRNDGTGTIYDYDGQGRTTVFEGVLDAPRLEVVSGTRTVTQNYSESGLHDSTVTHRIEPGSEFFLSKSVSTYLPGTLASNYDSSLVGDYSVTRTDYPSDGAAATATSSSTSVYSDHLHRETTNSDGSATYYFYDSERRVTHRIEQRLGKFVATVSEYGSGPSRVTTWQQPWIAVTSGQSSPGSGGNVTTQVSTTVTDSLGESISYLHPHSVSYGDFDLKTSTTETVQLAAGTITRTTSVQAEGLPESVTQSVSYSDGSPYLTRRKFDDGTFKPISRNDYSVEAGQLVTTTYSFRDGDAETGLPAPAEWSKTYSLMGRTTKAARNGLAPVEYFYDNLGRLVMQTQGDHQTLYSYNARGEVELQASDLDLDGTISLAGFDRVSKTEVTYENDASHGPVRRTKNYTYATYYGSAPTLLATTDQSLSESKSWTSYPDGTSTYSETLPADGNGLVVSTTISRDGTRTFRTSKHGYTQSETFQDRNGTNIRSTTYTYNDLLAVDTSTDSRTGTTNYGYSTYTNRLETVTGPDPDGAGSLTRPVSTTAYDWLGRIFRKYLPDHVETTHPSYIQYSYFIDGSLQNQSGPATYPVEYTYDRQGRMATQTTHGQAGNEVTSWAYNNAGQLASKTHPAMDEDGNGTLEPARAVTYTYDDYGQLHTRKWGRDLLTTYHYHPRSGQLAYVNYSDANTRDLAYEYDRVGNLTKVEEGNLAQPPEWLFVQMPEWGGGWFQTDSSVDPEWAWDDLANLAGLNYLEATFEYGGSWDDGLNTIFDWGILANSPPAAGSFIEIERDVFSEDGETHTYTYDDKLRLSAEKITGRLTNEKVMLSRRYHQASPQTGLSNGYVFSHGATGLETTESDVGYTWDPNGSLKTVNAQVRYEVTGGAPILKPFQFDYAYNSYGQLINRFGPGTDVVAPSGYPAENTLAGNKRLYTTTYTYESGRDGLLEVKNWLNVTRNTANGVVQPERRASIHTYTLNALGQRTAHREDMSQYYNGTTSAYDRDVSRTFGYDAKGQLVAATASYNNTGSLFLNDPVSEGETYAYDEIGNRTTDIIKPKPVLNAGWVTQTIPAGQGDKFSYASAKTNAYTTVTKSPNSSPQVSTLKYDADGNLINDGKYQYTWDGENRLIAMSPVPGTEYQGEGRYFYSYDYMGRRVTRTVDFRIGSSWAPKQKNTFVFEGWNVIGDFHTELAYNPAWTTLRCDRYVWGQDVSGSLQGAGGVGGLLLGVTQPSDIGLMANMGYTQAFCFLYDANGNVTDTVNEGGGIMGQYRYDGFGNLLGQTRTIGIRQTGVVQGLIDQPFGFSTKWVDSTDVMPLLYAPNANHRTLAYYGYRHYAPQLGRWINRDPIGEQGGLNLYGFLGNDGVGMVDVSGEMPLPMVEPGVASFLAHFTGSPTLTEEPRVLKLNCGQGVIERLLKVTPFQWIPGQIAQMIVVQATSKPCKGVAGRAEDYFLDMVEFFPFVFGSVVDTFHQTKIGGQGTCGTLYIQAYARWHRTWAHLGNNIPGPSGNNPWTRDLTIWDRIPGESSNLHAREFTVTWDCCGKDSEKFKDAYKQANIPKEDAEARIRSMVAAKQASKLQSQTDGIKNGTGSAGPTDATVPNPEPSNIPGYSPFPSPPQTSPAPGTTNPTPQSTKPRVRTIKIRGRPIPIPAR